MNNRRLAIVLAIVALSTVAVMYALYRGRAPYSWVENYQEKNKGPYGTYVLYTLLKTYFPGKPVTDLKKSIVGELPLNASEKASYVLIGEAQYMDSSDSETLLKFVRKGNEAFIASRTLPSGLAKALDLDICSNLPWQDYSSVQDTQAFFSFIHPSLKTNPPVRLAYLKPYLPRENTRPFYFWQYIPEDFFCDQEGGLVELGRLNRKLVNFARIRHGKGWFYLHTNPIIFSNLSLLDKTRLEYAGHIFSHLPEGPVYWDRYSKVPEKRKADSEGLRGNRRFSERSPLDYILRQPALAMAWYLILVTALLFLLFRTRRRQRLIPVLAPNRNTSLEFVQAIGKLNFLQQNHKKTAIQKMRLFLQFLRDRYQLSTRELDDEFVTLLSSKAQIDPEKIRGVLRMFQNIEKGSIVTENTLLEFHQRLEYLIHQCKQTSR